MKAFIILAFLIGAMLPVFWTFLALAMMHARGVEWLDYLAVITVPFWLLDWSYKGDFRIIPLNGLLYALVAFAITKLARAVRRSR